MKDYSEDKKRAAVTPMSAIPIGMCLGVCYGVVFDNLALGISLGVGIGGVVSAVLSRKKGIDTKTGPGAESGNALHPEKIENQTAEQ